jgi:alkyldihydroxyacetonephosphate synthase
VGALGVEVLRAVKARLDPRGICNPGVLLPD